MSWLNKAGIPDLGQTIINAVLAGGSQTLNAR